MQRRVVFLLCLLLSLSLGVLGKDKPKIERTRFNDNPSNLFYFDDSDVVLVTEPSSRTTYRSSDAGVTWKKLDGVAEEQVLEVLKHPYDNKIAIVIGTHKAHWITRDQGESWKKWESNKQPSVTRPAISFHASDPERMLFFTADCHGPTDCEENVYYTLDGFKSEPKLLREGAVSCLWAKTTDLFTTGSDKTDNDRILCIVVGSFNPFSNNYRLLTSDNFFKDEEQPSMNDGSAPTGFMRLAAVKSYIVAAAKSEGTTELAMYVTNNGDKWHRAEFGEHKLEEDAYTLLESTNYSMQVDVLVTKPTMAMGVLLTSNSNGTFFTKNVEHTNRNFRGFVDFEKVQNIQGIVLVNTVKNWEEVERNWLAEKEVVSKISFDDGRTWQKLKVGDDDELHLHSVTDQRNLGRIFSSPAPGIVMGIGNTGSYLRSRADGDLYVSDDAGLTWKKAASKPHLYEFGDQGSILVAVKDGDTDKLKYSLDHGESWEEVEFPDDDEIRPIALTTVPDSTSRKFILTAVKGTGSDQKFFLYSIDFDKLDIPKCKDKDFEDWWARVDKDGQPTCIMGHTQKFSRRKKDAKCFIDEDKFNEAKPKAEDCKCTDEDFECDFENGFSLRQGECKLTGTVKQPEELCEKDQKTYKGSSGYRLIPGNTCVRDGGKAKDKTIERECKELDKPVASGKISTELTSFKGDRFMEYYYLERGESSSGTHEAVIMRTDRGEAYLTHDHGKTWALIVDDEDVVAIYPHQYIHDNVYIITPTKKVFYSKNFGKDIRSFEAPTPPNKERLQIIGFHPTETDWLLWTGDRDGDSHQTAAHVTTHGGDKWEPLLRSVRKCQFVYREDRPGSQKLIYCEQFDSEDPEAPLQLLSSDDFFDTKKTLKRDVINFATMAEYIIVAVRDTEQQSLQVDTSIDGQVFADAKFPSNFKVPHQQAYTVLDSSTHAVFLHVTINNREDQEYGSILKSNSNGTSYVHAISAVNRNRLGYVDFEKMQGLEGVAIINRVANIDMVESGVTKKLKTYITHNDGADWGLIPRPDKEFDDKKFGCSGSTDTCSLHLHGYTERRDPRDTFSSPSAVGLMMATGNVGEWLEYKKEADTFITRDGGLSWQVAAPGNWMWEYGDQGSVIVIVKEDQPTSYILYSLDEGDNWVKFSFSDKEMLVQDITTVPSDTSLNFLLWGKIDGDLYTVNLDFSGLEERAKKCFLDENNPTGKESDYILWSPRHPNSDDNCLFGHEAQYHRKKVGRQCRNGDRKEIQHLHNIKQNCTCTRSDFECDYNYERQSDGHCSLVEGLPKPDPKAVCAKKGVKEYYDITGYRKIPISTCQKGRELNKLQSTVKPCPGYEEEFQRKHGISGVGLFFAIVIPIAAAAGIGYWVWKNWDGKFGRIRLGDGVGPLATSTGYSAFDRDAPWIKFPILALSGVVAVLAAVPMVVGSVYKFISARIGRRGGSGGYGAAYTSRSSFARGRGDYASVPDDEGELLGEDSDEDI